MADRPRQGRPARGVRPPCAWCWRPRPSPRRTAATDELTALGCSVRALHFDAQVVSDHAAVVEAAAEDGDIDVSVVAYGVLGDNERAWTDMDTAVDLARTNYVGPVASGVALAEQVRR